MAFSFFITMREGAEMALIIAILLGYLRSINQKQQFRAIWAGVAVAAVISVALGVAVKLASNELPASAVAAFEAFTMIFAVIVLTGMAFWMKRQARGISAELRAQVDRALSGGSRMALILLAATSVGREGLETVLFLSAGAQNVDSGMQYIGGGVAGFAVAGAIGFVVYRGSARFPLRLFFQLSGVTILVLAAGLLSNAAVHLYEATLVSDLGPRPWDTESFISITSQMGKFLNTLLGYDSAPSMLQIVLYWGYLLPVLLFFLFPARKRRAAARSQAVESAAGTTA